jgi:4-amino-4-deoxychorismate lyase
VQAPNQAPARCLVNGAPSTAVDVFDRGLAYGDGLFETLAIRHGRPCCWGEHLDRVRRGAARLRLPIPSATQLRADVAQVATEIERGVLKMILTRGPATRGYRPPEAPRPTRICFANDAVPDAARPERTPEAAVMVCRARLGINPQLAGIKHLNRLEQVLASAELAASGVDEGLMLDAEGFLVSGTMSNLFILDRHGLHTPLIDRCGVEGTARSLVLSTARAMDVPVQSRRLTLNELFSARAAFLTNAIFGIWPIRRVGRHSLDPALLPWPLLDRVHTRLLQPETDW